MLWQMGKQESWQFLVARILQFIAFFSTFILTAIQGTSRDKWNSSDFHHASHSFHLTIALSRYDVQDHIDIFLPVCILHYMNYSLTCADWRSVSNGPWSDRDRRQDRDSGSGGCHGADVCTHWPRLSAAASLPWLRLRWQQRESRHKVPLVIHSYSTIITPPLLHYNHTLVSHQAEIRVSANKGRRTGTPNFAYLSFDIFAKNTRSYKYNKLLLSNGFVSKRQ